MYHYVGPGCIPTCVPSDISSRDTSIVPGTYPYHNNMPVYSLVTISIPTTNAIQYPIDHNSILLYSVLTVDYEITYKSVTQKIIIK